MRAKRLLYQGFIILITLMMFMIINTGCYDNDDWAPYTRKNKDIDEALTANEINSLANIISDANIIAEIYVVGFPMTRITLTTEDAGMTGDIQFTFAEAYEMSNQVTIVDVFYDIGRRVFYKVEYEQGHGKRVSAPLEQIGDNYINMSLDELFALDDPKVDHLDESVKIVLTRESLSAYPYQK
ncbi:MAG: hypothetical protein LBL96_07860 [Clostridiales bacterium]|nr:hypothetical protein [Clostridiales bacterium]